VKYLSLVLALLFAPLASAEFLGDYAIGDSVTLRFIINDEYGSVVDSVSGDTIEAAIYWQQTAVSEIVGGLTQVGAGVPESGLFTATIEVDTAGGGFGSWYALLYAVDWDTTAWDRVGINSWTVSKTNGEDTTATGFFLGQYAPTDSITVGGRFVGVDSVEAHRYWRMNPVDTTKLTADGYGYYATLYIDTTGHGLGSWRVDLKPYGGQERWQTNTFHVFDTHDYAAEIADSADVAIHDPDDSTTALIVRDSMNAWADSFIFSGSFNTETTYVNLLQWADLANANAESIWTGASFARTLDVAEYQEIAESSAAHISALDTIAYVTHVGSVTVVAQVDSVGKATLLDSARVFRSGLWVDSVGIATKLDSLRIVRQGLWVDSVGLTTEVDSVRVARTVLTANLVDSARVVRQTLWADSTGLATVLDSARVVRQVLWSDSTGISTLNDSLRVAAVVDSAKQTGKAIFVDSARVVRTALWTDSTGLATVLDSARVVRQVLWSDSTGISTFNDSLRAGYHIDTTSFLGRAKLVDSMRVARTVLTSNLVDSARVVRQSLWTDSTGLATVLDSARLVRQVLWSDSTGISTFNDSLRAAATIDTVKKTGVALTATIVDSARVVRQVLWSDSTGISTFNDSLRVVRQGLFVDSVGIATELDSLRVVRTTLSGVDSVRAVGTAYLVDSTRVTRQVLWTDSTGIATELDSLRVARQVLWSDSTGISTFNDSLRVAYSVLTADSTGIVTFADSLRATGVTAAPTLAEIADTVWTHILLGESDTMAAGEFLVKLDTNLTAAKESLDATVSGRAAPGAAMTITPEDKGEIADTVWTHLVPDALGLPATGRLISYLHPDSLASVNTIAGAVEESLVGSAVADTLDSVLVQLGHKADAASADGSAIAQIKDVKANLNAVSFDADAAALVKDSILNAALDTSGVIAYDSGTVGAALWEAQLGERRRLYVTIDSTTKDTSGTPLGAPRRGGDVLQEADIYVYTFSDSGWSQVVNADLTVESDGRFYVPVFFNQVDTVFYRVRFHALGSADVESIVRFPQP
jgi:hypothetical protein